jgi:PadR family transcriptional regulator, regulatory protein AphA
MENINCMERIMEYRAEKIDGCVIVETIPGRGVIGSENDALELVAACGEHQAESLLIHSENLNEEFFQLSSGLAGAVLLKFSIYRIRVAAVILDVRVNQGRFAEFVVETNKGRQFRIYNNRQEAIDWLIGS